MTAENKLVSIPDEIIMEKIYFIFREISVPLVSVFIKIQIQ